MPTPNPSVSANTKTAFERAIDWWKARLERDDLPKHPGAFAYTDDSDGYEGYGDVHEDRRPAFIKQDEQGWVKLWP